MKESGLDDLEVQARIRGYERINFEEDWEITLPIPARRLFQVAAHLARFEGMINHARALEARLPHISPDAQYKIGRLKNGCSTAYVSN